MIGIILVTHEVCESDAVGVKRSLLHRMFVK